MAVIFEHRSGAYLKYASTAAADRRSAENRRQAAARIDFWNSLLLAFGAIPCRLHTPYMRQYQLVVIGFRQRRPVFA